MSGKAKDKKTFGKKIKDISNDTSTLYSLNKNIISSAEKSAVSGSINNTEVRGQFTTLATADLNMRTYDIIDLDRLRFATSKGAGDVLTATDYGVEALYSGNPETAYGIQIRVPSAKSIYLRSGATALATFDDQNGFVTGMGIIGGSLSTSGVVDFDNMVSPSNPATDHVKLFADSDNSNHLTVRKSDGSEVDLETSSSSWVGTATSDLNMATYDITNICRLEFDPAGSTLANSTTGIDATATKMHFNVPTGDSYSFTINGDEKFWIGNSQLDFKSQEIIQIGKIDSDIKIEGSHKIMSDDSTKIGIQVTDNSITVGDYGTLQLPYIANSSGSPADSTLDDWFGNANGCIGIQYETVGGTHRLWFRSNAGWVKNFGT
jgi:hypothetical protein